MLPAGFIPVPRISPTFFRTGYYEPVKDRQLHPGGPPILGCLHFSYQKKFRVKPKRDYSMGTAEFPKVVSRRSAARNDLTRIKDITTTMNTLTTPVISRIILFLVDMLESLPWCFSGCVNNHQTGLPRSLNTRRLNDGFKRLIGVVGHLVQGVETNHQTSS